MAQTDASNKKNAFKNRQKNKVFSGAKSMNELVIHCLINNH